jgi:hypothetical protein
VLRDRAQELRRETSILEEVEDARRAVVTRRVVGRPGEAGSAAPVGNARRVVLGRQLLELGEPARVDGSHLFRLRRQPQEAVALTELEVLVAAANDPGVLEPVLRDREGNCSQCVVDIDEKLGATLRAGPDELVQTGDDVRGLEEDSRDEHGARPLADGSRHPRGECLDRIHLEAHDVQALLTQACELAPQRVELALRGDELRATAQVERRQEAHDELVRVLRQRDRSVVGEQLPEAHTDALGLRERALPLLVDSAGGVLEGFELPLPRDIRPGLMRVPGEKEPLAHAERGVVRGDRVRRSAQLFE